MNWESLAALISIALISPMGVVWLIRLEGRVNQHQTLFEERKDLEAERYQTILREISSLREMVAAALVAEHDGRPNH